MTLKLKERIKAIREFCPALGGLKFDSSDVDWLEMQIEEIKKRHEKLALKNKKKNKGEKIKWKQKKNRYR